MMTFGRRGYAARRSNATPSSPTSWQDVYRQFRRAIGPADRLARNLMNQRPVLLVALLALLPLASCDSIQWTTSHADPAAAEVARSLTYPDQTERGEPIDIVVRREGQSLVVTNRTAQSLEGVQIWLNREYVHVADRIAVGANPSIPLNRFVNRHEEPLPTPGLLTPDRGLRVVLAEIYVPQTRRRHALLVQLDDNET